LRRALIATALDLETAAVLGHLSVTDSRVDPQGTYYTLGQFNGRLGVWEVALVEVGQGNTASALLTALAVPQFQPDVLLMVGVAGGLKDDVQLGDVVAAPTVHGYEKGKETDTAFLPRPEVFRSSHRLVEAARQVKRLDRWQARIVDPRGHPKALVQPIAAGQKVLASQRGPVREFLATAFSDTVAVEMEGLGFQAAAYVHNVQAIIIRGVSDMLSNKTEAESAGWQPSAARHAAGFAFELLSELEDCGERRHTPAQPGLPPAMVTTYNLIVSRDQRLGARLFDAIQFPPGTARMGVAELVNSPPSWLAEGPAALWSFLGSLADVHNAPTAASRAYERAAREGAAPKWRWLARAAASATAANDRRRAEELLEEAARLSPDDVFVATMAAAIRGDATAGARLTDRSSVDDEESLLLDCYLAIARWHWGDRASALGLLRSLAIRHQDRGAPRLLEAELLVAGATQGLSVDRMGDLRRALQLATEVQELAHRWGGAAVRAIVVGSVAAASADDPEGALKLALGRDLGGEAVAEEAKDSQVLAVAARAAIQAGRDDVLLALEPLMRGTFAAALTEAVRIRRETGPGDKAVEAFTTALAVATQAPELFSVLYNLADLGAEVPADKMSELARADPELADIVHAQAEATAGRFDSAMESLRRWTPTSPEAVRALGFTHALAGNMERAVETFRECADKFGVTTSLLDAMNVAIQGGRSDLAEQAGEDALVRLPEGHPGRAYALGRLVELAAVRQEWRLTEERARLLRRIADSGSARWALAAALFNQTKLPEAWSVVSEDPELEPPDTDRGRMKLILLAASAPTEKALREAIRIAEAFPDSEELVAATLQTIWSLHLTGEIVDSYQRRVAVVTERFFTAFPDSSLLRLVPISGPEDILRLAQKDLAEGSDELRLLEGSVRAGAMPYGLLAAAIGRPYAIVVAGRGAGFLVAAPRSPDEADSGQEAASTALGGSVVADTTVFAVAGLVADGWQDLSSKFHRVSATNAAVRDAMSAQLQASTRPFAIMTIEPQRNEAVLIPVSEEQAEQVAAAVQELAARMGTADQVVGDSLPAFAGLQAPDSHLAWLSPIQVALDRHVPLWSDDAAQRALAREVGVEAFGTPDLLEVLRRNARLPEERAANWKRAMIEGRVGDFPLDAQLVIDVAASAGWEPGPASSTLARAAAWADLTQALATFTHIFRRVTAEAPDWLAHWLQVAIAGAAARAPGAAHVLAGASLGMAIVALSFNPAEVPRLASAARRACQDVGAGDPLPPAIERILEAAARLIGRQRAAALTVSAFAQMPDGDKEIVARIVFPAKS
jgi:nucleoside phosphorylase/tetratricopeptide (TPR) repeat protein